MAEYLLLRENIIKDLVTLVSILAGSLEGGSSLISCGTTIGALQGLQRSKKPFISWSCITVLPLTTCLETS